MGLTYSCAKKCFKKWKEKEIKSTEVENVGAVSNESESNGKAIDNNGQENRKKYLRKWQ